MPAAPGGPARAGIDMAHLAPKDAAGADCPSVGTGLCRAGYDREADHYDEVRFGTAAGGFSALLDDAIVAELLWPCPGKVFLDLPAGTARSSIAVAKTGANVVAVDLSKKMLLHGQEKVLTNVDLRIGFVQADGTRMPFPDNTFDGICCLRLFHLVPPHGRSAFVREFRRVLRPGGLLVVEFPRRLHAGGVVWLAAKITGRRRWHYLTWGEANLLFAGFESLETRGGYFPLMGRLAHRNPGAALRANLAIARSWLRLFTRQAFLLYRKTG